MEVFITSVAEVTLPVELAQGRRLGTNCNWSPRQLFPSGYLRVCSGKRCGILSHKLIGDRIRRRSSSDRSMDMDKECIGASQKQA